MAPDAPWRVLLVDDSPTVRAVLRRILKPSPDLEVVGEAEDGEQAVRRAVELAPDVILMDISMPRLDGFEATSRIMARAPTAIMVFSTEARVDGDRMIFEAVERGARNVLAKPESPAGWTALSRDLPSIVRDVAGGYDGQRVAAARSPPAPAAVPAATFRQPLRYLAVGASTGGPEALRELLAELAPKAPLRVLIVQHIAPEFEDGLIDWLHRDLQLDIRLARDGEIPPPGAVRVGPQGSHLKLSLGGRLRLDPESPPRRGHRPSVDELFASCAAVAGAESAGILLSGMGRDGVEGLQAMCAAGATTLVQDQISSVVFGMPMAALAAGAARIALPPRELARYILQGCGETTS